METKANYFGAGVDMVASGLMASDLIGDSALTACDAAGAGAGAAAGAGAEAAVAAGDAITLSTWVIAPPPATLPDGDPAPVTRASQAALSSAALKALQRSIALALY